MAFLLLRSGVHRLQTEKNLFHLCPHLLMLVGGIDHALDIPYFVLNRLGTVPLGLSFKLQVFEVGKGDIPYQDVCEFLVELIQVELERLYG
jgi:hypothetical protein